MPELRITNHGLTQSGISDPAGGGIAVLPAGQAVTVRIGADVLSRILPQLSDLRARQLQGGGDAFTIEFLDELDSPADFGGEDAVAYAMLNVESGVGTQNVSSGLAPVIVNQLTSVGPAIKNVVVNAPNGTLTVHKAGVYRIAYHLAFLSNGGPPDPVEYTFRLRANGTPLPGSYSHTDFTGSSNHYKCASLCIVELPAGAVVDLEVISASVNPFTFDVEHGSLVLEMLEEVFP